MHIQAVLDKVIRYQLALAQGKEMVQLSNRIMSAVSKKHNVFRQHVRASYALQWCTQRYEVSDVVESSYNGRNTNYHWVCLAKPVVHTTQQESTCTKECY